MNNSVLSIEMEVEVVVTMVMVVIMEVFELYIIVSNRKDMEKLTHGPRVVMLRPSSAWISRLRLGFRGLKGFPFIVLGIQNGKIVGKKAIKKDFI